MSSERAQEPSQQPVHPVVRVRTRVRLLEALAGTSAVVISLSSLFVAVRQNNIQERMLAASVWPTLQIDSGNRDDTGADVINVEVTNNGIGPARVFGFEVLYNGRPESSADELLRACCVAGEKKTTTLTTITSAVAGHVIKAGADVAFIRFAREKNAPEIWDAFNRERFKVRVRGCFCSVLDDCWSFSSNPGEQAEVVPLQRCPEPGGHGWRG